jgi:RecA/RadA recombinase
MATEKKKKIVHEVETVRDELASTLAEALNKANKDNGKVAFFLNESEDPSKITDWISTGEHQLDISISNRPNGGLPVGRITELTGLEACVTRDTKIKALVDGIVAEIEIGEVQNLLNEGKAIKVLTLGGEFATVKKFIDKGVLKTYEVHLENKMSIKCSANHLFYANSGWIKTSDLIPGTTKLMTETTKFVTVDRVDYIGEHPIVDITVDHPEECYYGNGILNHNSGKSLVAAHLLADTQRKGGQAIFIDTEFAVSPEFLTAIGVDVNKMLYVNATTVEDIFDNIELLVSKIRSANKNRLVTIVVDSMAAASTKKEMASDHGADGFATNKAIAISKAMRKITEMIARERICLVFTNQLRQKIGFVGFGDPWCVDPFTTVVDIRNHGNDYKLTLAEFSERFLSNNDFTTPQVFDVADKEIEVLTKDGYKRIFSFLVKPAVDNHYTDGVLKGTSNHRVIEADGTEVLLKDHPAFSLVEEPMNVVDIEVDGASYLANGRNNHNTTSGGKALSFHASVRIRLKSTGSIKNGDQPIGIKTKAVIIKNRMGPPLRGCEFNIFFDRGIDGYSSWLETLIDNSVITPAKIKKDDNGVKKTKKQLEEELAEAKKTKSLQVLFPTASGGEEQVIFEKKDFPTLLKEREDVKKYLYDSLCDICIMKYKSPDSVLEDDVEIDSSQEGIDE